jgi:hypothetical protein
LRTSHARPQLASTRPAASNHPPTHPPAGPRAPTRFSPAAQHAGDALHPDLVERLHVPRPAGAPGVRHLRPVLVAHPAAREALGAGGA